MLKIQRSKAVGVLLHCGWSTAANWPDERIEGKLADVADIVKLGDSGDIPDEFRSTLDLILIEDGDENPTFGVIPDEENTGPVVPAEPVEDKKPAEKPAEDKKPVDDLDAILSDGPMFTNSGEGQDGPPGGDGPDDTWADLGPEDDDEAGAETEQVKIVVTEDPETPKVPVPKAKKKDGTKKTKTKPTGPNIRGMKSRRTRFYVAGNLLLERGFPDMITPELVQEFDERYGTESKPRDALNILRSAWQAINGYRGNPTIEDKAKPTVVAEHDDTEMPPAAD